MSTNKNIIIVGASEGIGRALAFEFARRGYRLMLGSRNLRRLEEVRDQLGSDVFVQKCDVTVLSDWVELSESAIRQLGSIDCLLVNSGVSITNMMDNFSAERAIQTFDVNTFGIVRALEVFVPIFRRQGYGTLAGVGSLADCRGIPRSGAYNASKAAMAEILESARIELHSEHIRVVTVKPGFVRTAMTAKHKYKMPLIMTPEHAALIIADGIERGKERIYFPFATALATRIARAVPDFFYEWAFKNWDN